MILIKDNKKYFIQEGLLWWGFYNRGERLDSTINTKQGAWWDYWIKKNTRKQQGLGEFCYTNSIGFLLKLGNAKMNTDVQRLSLIEEKSQRNLIKVWRREPLSVSNRVLNQFFFQNLFWHIYYMKLYSQCAFLLNTYWFSCMVTFT